MRRCINGAGTDAFDPCDWIACRSSVSSYIRANTSARHAGVLMADDELEEEDEAVAVAAADEVVLRGCCDRNEAIKERVQYGRTEEMDSKEMVVLAWAAKARRCRAVVS